ncbi:MAG: SMI1/KNR4 family protein [Pirellulaceae bacterium]|nr:SMI1/KNR4 family protein [Pirellulaceae bacterium]
MNQHLQALISRVGDFTPAVGDALNPLRNADVEAIEKSIDRPLDSVHRELLTLYGASRFEEHVFFTPEMPLPKSYSKSNVGIVGTFLGKLNENYPRAKGISILHKLDTLDGELPPDFLPMADVGSGDLYGIRRDGSVWLWIHDARKGKELNQICSSFPAWIDLLNRKEA